jgi:hypothetical protein
MKLVFVSRKYAFTELLAGNVRENLSGGIAPAGIESPLSSRRIPHARMDAALE